jgi:hypothetical protein
VEQCPLGVGCSFAALEWDRDLRHELKLTKPELAPMQRLSTCRLVGKELERVLDGIGIRTWSSVDFDDISLKPATWTGLAENSEKDLALTRGVRLSHKSLRRISAESAFFANAQLKVSK